MEFAYSLRDCASPERLLSSSDATAPTYRVTTVAGPPSGKRRALYTTSIESRPAGARADAFESLAEVEWRTMYPSILRFDGREMELDAFLTKIKWYSKCVHSSSPCLSALRQLSVSARRFLYNGTTFRWSDQRNRDMEVSEDVWPTRVTI